MSCKYLFLFSISPVQSFISQARKTKDLYAGSFLLSYLCKNAIKKFEEEGGKIIFPKKYDSISVSNTFLGEIEIKEDELDTKGKEIEEQINKKLNGLGDCIANHIKNELNQLANNLLKEKFSNIVKKQLESLFEMFWIFYPEGEDYKKAYIEITRHHNAIKNIRKFSQLEEEGKRKCSICGERNALFYRGKKKSFLIDCALNVSEVAEDEALCAVCYLKRILDKSNIPNIEKGFPSLAKITLLDWLDGVNYNELKKTDGFDEEWFLEDNKREEIIAFIKKNNLDIKKQKKYYALIRLDVDDFGKWLSGAKSSTDDLREFQKKLSETLADFSQDVKEVLEKNGKAVYVGGDDFLGFVNLKYLFDVLTDIKENKFKSKFENSDFRELTCSVSLVIAHYKTPLHKVLEYSRNLMEETKEFFHDKNGVGIMVMNTSSVTAKTICKYDDFVLLKDMLEKKMGYNLFFKLGKEFPFLSDVYTFDEFLLNKEMLITETHRLLKRESNYNTDIDKRLIQFIKRQNIEYGRNAEGIDFENIIGFLKTLEQLRKVMKWDI